MKKFLTLFAIVAFTMSCNTEKKNNQSAQDAVLENIMTRTSIRAFTSEAVPENMIEAMLKAGMSAPSAMNRQPWEFVVVRDRALLDKLAERLKYAKMLFQAPLAIVVCAHNTFVNRDGVTVTNWYWKDDTSAATENILLAAHALGLGAVWTAASDDERADIVREELNLPEGIAPLCVIPIGFPAENPTPKDKWKPEKVHYDKTW